MNKQEHDGFSGREGPSAPPQREPASFGLVSSPARFVPLGWSGERATLLHGICARIERRRSRGQTLEEAVGYYAWAWKGKNWHSAPDKRVRLSRGTIVRHYYYWRSHGKSPSVFADQFSRKAAIVEGMPLLVGACAHAGVQSVSCAARLMQLPEGITVRGIIAALPLEVRLAIKSTHARRRDMEKESQAAIRAMRRALRALLLEDLRQSRRLRNLAKRLEGRPA